MSVKTLKQQINGEKTMKNEMTSEMIYLIWLSCVVFLLLSAWMNVGTFLVKLTRKVQNSMPQAKRTRLLCDLLQDYRDRLNELFLTTKGKLLWEACQWHVSMVDGHLPKSWGYTALDRSEVLRSLRRYQQAQNHRHHTIDRLADGERHRKRKRSTVFLEGRGKSHIVSQIDTGTVSKAVTPKIRVYCFVLINSVFLNRLCVCILV